MNYSTLKSMIESLMKGYSCPSCNNNSISEQDIDIVGAAGNTINIDMKCPSCQKHYMARMEVVGIDMSNQSQFSKEGIQNIKMWMGAFKNAFAKMKNQEVEENISSSVSSIKDDEIVNLSKDLKTKKLSAKDLFDQ